jgi:RND family efflux transporter MFP subunit
MISYSTYPNSLKYLSLKPAVFLLIPLLLLSGCSNESEKITPVNAYHQNASLLTITPEESYIVEREYLGQITAKQQTNLSFEYAGKVDKIFIDSGDIVHKGQRLAQQDTQLLGYKTSELQAQISQSQAQITLNKANLTRINTLISDGYSSKQQLDELNAENKILNAQIAGLNARIQTLEYQQDKSSLVAPFDGVITKRLISNGDVVSPNMASFRMIENENMEINVGIPSKVARSLRLKKSIKIKIGEQNKQAKIIAIGHQIDAINRTVNLRLKMLDTLDKTKSFNGQLVRVIINQEIKKPGFWIPINAVTDGVRGQWQIFIASEVSDSKANYRLESTTVNVQLANEHSVYVDGLALKAHNIIDKGVHRYVAGQVISKSSQAKAIAEGAH